MSLQSHLSELAAKHKALESELQDALSHPSSSDQEIAELKRKKLKSYCGSAAAARSSSATNVSRALPRNCSNRPE